MFEGRIKWGYVPAWRDSQTELRGDNRSSTNSSSSSDRVTSEKDKNTSSNVVGVSGVCLYISYILYVVNNYIPITCSSRPHLISEDLSDGISNK